MSNITPQLKEIRASKTATPRPLAVPSSPHYSANPSAGCARNSLAQLAKSHPCFAAGKPNHKGRMHLPVSPGCNIGCRFCERAKSVSQQQAAAASIRDRAGRGGGHPAPR